MGDHETGSWLEETAGPYNVYTGAGHHVDIVSISGGEIPIDKGSRSEAFYTEECKKFEADATATQKLKNSLKLGDVQLTDYDAVHLSGGHGTCVDFYNNTALYSAVDAVYAAGKIVAAVCHGPTGILGCKKPDGSPLVQGLTVTGFTDSEEAAVGLTSKVPVLLESEMKRLGGKFIAGADWTSNVQVDGKLVTGQNPQSSVALAEAVVKLLG
uniref:DJ-1/PfpI domain-containing protein n=1 Tax=Eutreptiella gymnastica TaxID=73025 RepID=A0A7S4C940_9EUGL